MNKYEGLKNQPFWRAVEEADVCFEKQRLIMRFENLAKNLNNIRLSKEKLDKINELFNQIKSIIS
jgi:hypothetical protein